VVGPLGISTDASLLNRHRLKEPIRFWRALPCLRVAAPVARRLPWLAGAVLAMLLVCHPFPAGAQVDLPPLDRSSPVSIIADQANRWTQGIYEVWLLRGNCRIRQGFDTASAREAVLWIERTDPTTSEPSKVIAYLEGAVAVDFSRNAAKAELTDNAWLGRFQTAGKIDVKVPEVNGPLDELPPIYHRAMAKRNPVMDGAVRRTQYTQFDTAPAAPAAPTTRRIRLFARGELPVQAEWNTDPATQRAIGVIEGGVTLVIDGVPQVGSLDISTDRLVIWTADVFQANERGETLQANNTPLEIYMEGNIVFRQDQRVIYADRMYYDVNNHVGIVLNADLLAPVPNYQGLVRLRSAILRQTGEGRFFAEDSFITSSRLGVPGYRLQVGDASFEDTPVPAVNPITGEAAVQHQRLATARNNVLYIRQIPIFYWPVITTNLEEPTTYVRRLRFRNDDIFGQQVLTNWNGYQLFGVQPIPGTDLDLSLDYLSKRGFGHGGTFTYCRDDFFGIPGPTAGLVDFWGIQDKGLDNLGADRFNIEPEKKYRFRLFEQHRQLLPNDFQFTAQTLWISDRNFLEQYFEREWDDLLVENPNSYELKQSRDNWSWALAFDTNPNPFFTQTEWLPRADHFQLGQSLFNLFTWYEHSTVGYARFRTANPPENANDQPFIYRPWEVDPADPTAQIERNGLRAITRQEIDLPLQLGPVKVVPFALGELGFWQEDLSGEQLDRAVGKAGVRASLPFWRVYPDAESLLWNVHGLAHKVTFDVEASVSESNRSLTELPLYDPLDDPAIQAFRRRFAGTTFGGAVPLQFDERFYALRRGMQDWVTAPSMEIADDLALVRLGMENRWQTKRGAPGCQRIIDWITLDTGLSFFPNQDRDNFGELVGLLDYDFRWHVGDRLTLMSDGFFDFVEESPSAVSVAAILSRPPRGSLYVGLHFIDGPIQNTILSTSYTYRLSPKWASTAGVSIDLVGKGGVGQHLSLTRIGESFLVSLSGSFDPTRDNFGLQFSVEPRFLPGGRLGSPTGVRIPPAGALGLE
jgi:hypothetical protein